MNSTMSVKLERIQNMRKGKRTNRRLSHWTYTDIFSKLESKCEEQGVLVTKISPTYTSKRCSNCGWTRRNNRNGKEFRCKSCDFTIDADLNASINIAANLKPIGYRKLPRKPRPLAAGSTDGQSGIYACGDGSIEPSLKQEKECLVN